MRLISFSAMISFALASSAALAQQQTPGSIGSPPPLSGPPPMAAPPPATNATPQGYTGAYAPPSTSPTPYSTGPLPAEDTGTGLDIVAADGLSTKRVKAVPCSKAARETDGFTTCVGLPGSFRKSAHIHRRDRN
jgi:hypothetical protein